MTITRTYQWYRTATSDPTASPAALSGATAATYTTVTADVGNYLHMKETATNTKGSATATSNVVGPVATAGVTYSPAAGTVAPLTQPPAGVPNIPRIIRDNEQAVYDNEIVSMASLHTLMHNTTPSTKAVASGLWSAPSTWDNGVPVAGMTVHIPTGFDVLYDAESNAQLKYVMVHGKLRWDVTKDTKLICDTIHTGPGSYFEMGTSSSPIPESGTAGKPRANVVFIGDAPGSSVRLGLMTMGKVSIYGAKKTPKVDLSVDPAAGATTLTVKAGFDVSGWKVGDALCVLSRDYTGFGNDPQYTGPTQYAVRDPNTNMSYNNEPNGFKKSHDEIRTITAISGQTITLSSGLTYAHPTRATARNLPLAPTALAATYGFVQGQPVKLPPRVMNLSRSIRFESGGAPLSDRQKRGHIMFMASDQVDVRWAEAKNMARTDVDCSLYISEPKYGIDHFYNKDRGNQLFSDNTLTTDLADLNNVRGRYAWHMHGSGVFGQGASFQRNMNVFQGLTAWAPQNEVPQPGWAITHHNSRLAVHDCCVYNVRGAGIVSEVGTEIGQWVGNTVAWARGDGFPSFWAGRQHEQPNHNGHAGVAYEGQARQVLYHNNEFTSARIGFNYGVQAGREWGIPRGAPHSQGLRLFNPIVSENPGRSALDSDTYGEAQAQIPDMSGAFGCDFDRFLQVEHRSGVLRQDTTAMLADGWIAYGGNEFCHVDNYTYNYFFKNFAFFGATGGNAVTLGTRSFVFGFKNAVVEGVSNLTNPGGEGNHGPGWIDFATDATAIGDVIPQLYTSESQMPVTTPSLTVINTGPNYNITLNANNVSNPISFSGHMTDGYSPSGRHWPMWWEGAPYGLPTPPSDTDDVMMKEYHGDAKRIIERNGVFQSGGSWFCPCYFVMVDWRTFNHFTARIDLPLAGPWDSSFLSQFTVTPTPPTVPLLPEDIYKPFPVISPPTNVTPPFLSGPFIVGMTAKCYPGDWSGKPNDVDFYGFQWLRNGVAISGAVGRTYVIATADVGQSLTCTVTAYNSGGASSPTATAAVTPRQITAPTPDTIFGATLKDVWTGEDGSALQGEPGPIFSPGISERSRHEIELWSGAKMNGALVGGGVSGIVRRYGWLPDKSKCIDISGDAANYRTPGRVWAPSLTPNNGSTGFHMWVVIQRPNFNQTQDGPMVRGAGHDSYLHTASNDPAQNTIYNNAGGTERIVTTSFPKNGAGVLYHARNSQGSLVGFNNVRLAPVANGFFSGSERDFDLGINASCFMVKAVFWIEADVLTTQQYADMQSYLAQRYL